MKYMVTWTRNAQNDLADIWMNAADRQAVRDAANRIDRALERNPETLGHPLGDDRVYADAPLAVTFSVSPPDRRVWVWQVERI
jgi:plasmid stabilization system protein ParE